jgi:lysozyme family protein
MAEFIKAYKKTCTNEGDTLSNDPADMGGVTYGGLSQKNNPTWAGWQIIKEKGLQVGETCPELEQSKQDWYEAKYWTPINGDSINDQDLANQVFDMAVNAGVGTALEMLKQS